MKNLAYTAPAVRIVSVNVRSQILTGSTTMGLSNTEYSGTFNSREDAGFWEEDGNE